MTKLKKYKNINKHKTIEKKINFGLRSVIDYGLLKLEKMKFNKVVLNVNSKSVKIYTLQSALRNLNIKNIIKNFKTLDSEKNKPNYIETFIASHYKNSYVLFIKAQKDIINIDLYFSQISKNSIGYVILVIEEYAEVDLNEFFQVNGLIGVQFDIVLMKNSIVNYLSYSKAKVSKTLLINRNFYLFENAKLYFTNINIEYLNYYDSTFITLDKNSNCDINGVGLSRKSKFKEGKIKCVHVGNNSNSNIMYKNIIANKSKTFFNGLININDRVKDCKGNLREDNLIVSNEININTTPNLQINNNQVSCTHSVSFTRINPENKFYLQSKGLNEKQSKSILVNAHLSQVVDKIKNFGLREDIKKQIN